MLGTGLGDFSSGLLSEHIIVLKGVNGRCDWALTAPGALSSSLERAPGLAGVFITSGTVRFEATNKDRIYTQEPERTHSSQGGSDTPAFASPAPRATRTKDARYEVLASYQPLAYACTVATRNSTSTSSRRISSHSVLFSHSALLILDSGTFAKSRTLPVLSLVPLCICSCSVQDLLQVAGIAPPAPYRSATAVRQTPSIRSLRLTTTTPTSAIFCLLRLTKGRLLVFLSLSAVALPAECTIVRMSLHRPSLDIVSCVVSASPVPLATSSRLREL